MEPTLKNMLVKLDHFPQMGGKNKQSLKPPTRYFSENHHQRQLPLPPGRLLGEEEVQFVKDYLHLRIPRCEHLDFLVSPKFVANPWFSPVPWREKVGKMNPVQNVQLCDYIYYMVKWHLPKRKIWHPFKSKITDFSLNQVFWLVLRLWDIKLFLNI